MSAILSAKFMSCFSTSGGFAPRPPPGLRPWTLLGDFRPPDTLSFAPQPLTSGDAAVDKCPHGQLPNQSRLWMECNSVMITIPV